MYAPATTYRPETLTRTIARWGSLVAAVMLAVAYLLDVKHDPFLSFELGAFTTLMVTAMAGYALAWTERWEALGSVVAVVASLGAYFLALAFGSVLPNPAFLLVSLPALLHLYAVWLHRHERRDVA